MTDVVLPAWAVIAGAELRLLRRSFFAASTAVLLPTAFGLAFVWLERTAGGGDYAAATSVQLAMLLAFTPYVAATTMLAARRQQLVLKRLRTSTASDAAVVGGLLLPSALLVAVQAAVLCTVTALFGGDPPHRLWPVVAATVAGTATACALAFVTAVVTPAPELAQLTTSPIAFAFFGGSMFVIQRPLDDVPWYALAAPGAAVAQLTRLGWHGDGFADGLRSAAPSLVALALLGVAGAWLARRFFRWEPRA